MTARDKHIGQVKAALQAYADRGVFRAFSEKPPRPGGTPGKYEFRFSWLPGSAFLLIYQTGSQTLTVKNVLPDVDKNSGVDRAFRAFLQQRHSEDLPMHRRVDQQQLKLSCLNQDRALSIRLKIQPEGAGAYAVNRALNVINDIFHEFIRLPKLEHYRRRTFGIPGE